MVDTFCVTLAVQVVPEPQPARNVPVVASKMLMKNEVWPTSWLLVAVSVVVPPGPRPSCAAARLTVNGAAAPAGLAAVTARVSPSASSAASARSGRRRLMGGTLLPRGLVRDAAAPREALASGAPR